MVVRHNNNGFTLVEILVVVSIIALLSSALFASFSQARAKARDSKRVQDLLEVQKALELYRAKNPQDKYPEAPSLPAGGQQYEESRASCWDCVRTIRDEKRLEELNTFLHPRPCDPLSTVNSDGTCTLGRGDDKGFFYKVNPDRSAYKIYVIGTVETDSIPISLQYTHQNQKSITISSSAESAKWKRLYCRFSGPGKHCGENED